MESLSQDGFIDLRPTLFLQRDTPGCKTPNGLLERIILDRDGDAMRLTTEYAAYKLFEATPPATDWLRQCANKSVVDYLRRQGIDYVVGRLPAAAIADRACGGLRYNRVMNTPTSQTGGLSR